jgi:hypothetical protein
MEQKIKQLLGEYAFTVAALQLQVETLQKELDECKKPTKKR